MRFIKYLPLLILLLAAYQSNGQDDGEDVEIFRFEEEEKTDPAQELWEKGEIAVREHMHDNAIKYFGEFLKQKDKSAKDYNEKYTMAVEYIVKSHLLLKDADGALAVLNAKRGDSPNHSLSHELTYCLGQSYALKGLWAEAEKILVPLATGNAAAELKLKSAILASDCMMKLGQWRLLADTLEKFNSQNNGQQSFDLLYRLSESYIALGENEKADETIAKLSKLKMDADSNLKFNMLFTRNLALLGKADTALSIFDKIASRMPDTPKQEWWLMLTTLADALYNANMLDDAFKTYESVLKMSSDQEQMLHANQYLFLICIKQNRKKDELIRRVDEFQKMFPSSKELIEMMDILARHLQKIGENGAAAEKFISLTKLFPDAQTMFNAFFNAGECFAAFGDFEAAISSFLSAYSRGNSDAEKASALFRAAELSKTISYAKKGEELAKSATRAINYFKEVADKYAGTPQAPRARFSQANLLEQTGQFKMAADVFGAFAESYKDDPQFEESVYRRGVCLRKGAKDTQEKLAAARFLSEGAGKMASVAMSNDSRIEAFMAFKEANAPKEAEAELNVVVANPSGSDKRLEALFRRAMLRYETGDTSGARTDTDSLRADFPGNKYTDQLCIFTGDSYANEMDWANARKYYSEAAAKDHNNETKPFALFESANASYKLGDFQTAIKYADELIALFSEQQMPSAETKKLLARAYYLLGDVYVSMSTPDFTKAQDCYGKSSEFSDDKNMKFASIGRRGDVFLQMASQNQMKLQNEGDGKKYFTKAIDYYDEIIKNYPIEHPIGLIARYKKANALKSSKDYDNALKEYKDFYACFEQRNGKHGAMDTFYFANAVYEMAEILELKGDEDSLNDASRFYSRLAATKHPSAGTARERVKTIRARLDEIRRQRHK